MLKLLIVIIFIVLTGFFDTVCAQIGIFGPSVPGEVYVSDEPQPMDPNGYWSIGIEKYTHHRDYYINRKKNPPYIQEDSGGFSLFYEYYLSERFGLGVRRMDIRSYYISNGPYEFDYYEDKFEYDFFTAQWNYWIADSKETLLGLLLGTGRMTYYGEMDTSGPSTLIKYEQNGTAQIMALLWEHGGMVFAFRLQIGRIWRSKMDDLVFENSTFSYPNHSDFVSIGLRWAF